MFSVPPIRDVNRNTQLRKLNEVNAIEPVAPFPRIENIGHSSDEPDRPDAIDERFRNDNGRQRVEGEPEAKQNRPTGTQNTSNQGKDDQHQLDEYV